MAVVAIDVAFIGIGENGHIASTTAGGFFHRDSFIIVDLDEAAPPAGRRGWFDSIDAVPGRRLDVVKQIMKSPASSARS